jgi:hypothetical protein
VSAVFSGYFFLARQTEKLSRRDGAREELSESERKEKTTREMQAVRSSVLQHVRVAIAPSQGRTRLRLPALVGDGCWRWFAVESHASGTYLDKNVVAERAISVVKKMQKVDASKVCLKHHYYRQTCNDSFVFSLLHLSLRLLPFLFLFYRAHSSASSICLGCKELLGKAK